MDYSPYRKDIDGLRAVAVLAVVLFHFRFGVLPQGFLGVDIFFVISGFLITGIINRAVSAGTFSFLVFYERRMRRILPALLTVVIVSVAAGYFLLNAGAWDRLAKSAVAATLFVANFFFLGRQGYFDTSAQTAPLLHTWSLGVEEQFYLVWPLLVIGLWLLARRRQAYRISLAAGLLVADLALAAYLDHNHSNLVFYASYTRIWEFLCGALLVYLPSKQRSAAWYEMVALAGMGCILLSLCPFHWLAAHPVAGMLLACAGSAALIHAGGHRHTWAARPLTPAPVVLIGRISYSLYLWHWPFWVFYQYYINFEQVTTVEKLVMLALLLVTSYLSWRYIEQPFRRAAVGRGRVLAVGMSGVAAVAALSVLVAVNAGFPGRAPAKFRAFQSKPLMWRFHCPQYRKIGHIARKSLCIVGDTGKTGEPAGVLWGDSHAAHMAPLVDIAARKLGIRVAVSYINDCPAFLNGRFISARPALMSLADRRRCIRRNRNVMRYLARSPGVRFVLLAGDWAVYPQVVTSRKSRKRGYALIKQGLRRFAARMARMNKHVLIMSTIPAPRLQYVDCYFGEVLGLLRRRCDIKHGKFLLHKHLKPFETLATGLARQWKDVDALILSKRFCDAGICSTIYGDEFIYRDQSHIRRDLHKRTRIALVKRLGLVKFIRRGLPPDYRQANTY